MVKKVPRGSRVQAADAYSTLLEAVLTNPSDIGHWTRLFAFPYNCLRVPKRGGKHQKQSLASKINRNIREFFTSHTGVEPARTSRKPAKQRELKPPEEHLRTLVRDKLNNGDAKGAARLASSSDTLAPCTDDTIKALKSKHPPKPPDYQGPPTATPKAESVHFQQSAISDAISSFPNDSACGLDGLRPEHLKNMTSACTGETGRHLIRQLTALANHLSKENLPAPVRQFFFGARLIALQKKDGGVRPIAIGNTVRRLVGKVTCATIKEKAMQLYEPHQLGFGVAKGAEGAVHAARRFLSSDSDMEDKDLFLKLDFKNAFNSIRRDVLLTRVKEHFPEIYNLILAAYGESSILLYGDVVLASDEGLQQGDPDGPFLFCLVVLPMIGKLKSAFNCWYLDDGALGGRREDVIDDLHLIQNEGNSLGLELNLRKCEVSFLNENCKTTNNENHFSAMTVVAPAKLTLLGAPIGDERSVDESLASKNETFSMLCRRLELMEAHDALYLLRFCFAAPKLMYILRCSPCFNSAALRAFDHELRSCAGKILNINFSDQSWLQATLPVRHGGLGLRTAHDLALPAYLSSFHASTAIIEGLLGQRFQSSAEKTMTATATSVWKAEARKEPPTSAAQRTWDEPIILRRREALLDSTEKGSACRARILAASAQHAGAWLNALPISTLGLRLNDEQLRIAAGLRIGAELCAPHRCARCGTLVDQTGTHGLHCKRSAGRHARHAEVNDIICRSLNSAQIPADREPPGISRQDGKRPDGVTRIPWREGRCLIWDYTCPDTLAPSHLRSSATSAGSAATEAERKKTRKYAALATRYFFAPVAIETLGSMGNEAFCFLKELGRRLEKTTQDNREPAFLFQRVSLAIQRCNAACVLAIVPMGQRLEDIYWSLFSSGLMTNA